MLVLYHLLLFTGFGPDVESQYALGFSYIFTIAAMLFSNMYFVVKRLIKESKLKALKKYNIEQHKKKMEFQKVTPQLPKGIIEECSSSSGSSFSSEDDETLAKTPNVAPQRTRQKELTVIKEDFNEYTVDLKEPLDKIIEDDKKDKTVDEEIGEIFRGEEKLLLK